MTRTRRSRVSEDPSRSRRAGAGDPAYFDVAILGRSGDGTRPVLGRADGRDHAAVDGLRRVQPYGGPKEIREYPFNDHEGGAGLPRGGQARLAARSTRRLSAHRRPDEPDGLGDSPSPRLAVARQDVGRPIPSSRPSDSTAWAGSAENGASHRAGPPVVTAYVASASPTNSASRAGTGARHSPACGPGTRMTRGEPGTSRVAPSPNVRPRRAAGSGATRAGSRRPEEPDQRQHLDRPEALGRVRDLAAGERSVRLMDPDRHVPLRRIRSAKPM